MLGMILYSLFKRGNETRKPWIALSLKPAGDLTAMIKENPPDITEP